MPFPLDKEAGGIMIPLAWVAAVVGAMATTIVVLFRWALRLLRENKELGQSLLDEKESKVNILAELKRKAEEKRRWKDTDRQRDDG